MTAVGEEVYVLQDEETLLRVQGELAQKHKMNFRPEIGLNPEFYPLILEGTKSTTIRFSKGSIHFPLHTTLPLIISTTREQKGDVHVRKIELKSFDTLNDEDARNDGFSNVSELVKVLTEIYGHIEGGECISIYHFDFVPKC